MAKITIKWATALSYKPQIVLNVLNFKHTYLDGIVPKATDDLVIVVLKTVNPFTIF